TKYEREYEEKRLIPMKKDEYIDIVIGQLEYLPQKTVIERITGDGSKENLIAPKWSIDKISVLGAIDKEMAQRNTHQGIFLLDEKCNL
ncbi:MAG: TIGR01212 family radical SAM protein, partial [Clostridia bacterium]|nr:TIGR01212 family radical SAM protein [Clostridia bacterium]